MGCRLRTAAQETLDSLSPALRAQVDGFLVQIANNPDRMTTLWSMGRRIYSRPVLADGVHTFVRISFLFGEAFSVPEVIWITTMPLGGPH